MKRLVAIVWVAALPAIALAQQSAGFKLEEHAVNSGGSPSGVVSTSASFRLKPASIGDGAVRALLAGPSFRADAGFSSAYPPPGEVVDLRLLADKTTLEWRPERSAARYDLYRDAISSLPGAYGACLVSAVEGTTSEDAETPGEGDGYFYLITAENRLHEEGTKGRASSGAERANAAPCP